jgi:hypothetical protein
MAVEVNGYGDGADLGTYRDEVKRSSKAFLSKEK